MKLSYATVFALAALLPTSSAAELVLVQGDRGAWLDGDIDTYRLKIDCTANWGSQGLANFMLETMTGAVDPNLTGVSGFQYVFTLPDDLPVAVADGISDPVKLEVEEFNDRIFWNVPITDELSSQFAYATTFNISFRSDTGPQSLTLTMDRPTDTFVGPTGRAWGGFLDICKSAR